jgi:outer membrane protein
VGIGKNCTFIVDKDLSSAARAELAANNLQVDNSLRPSLQLGIDYQINKQWLLNVTAWNIDIDTRATC